jgi:hypothetical protein
MMRLARREMKEDRISFHFDGKMGLLVVLPLDSSDLDLIREKIQQASLPMDLSSSISKYFYSKTKRVALIKSTVLTGKLIDRPTDRPTNGDNSICV